MSNRLDFRSFVLIASIFLTHFVVPSGADEVSLPQPWYDQDKPALEGIIGEFKPDIVIGTGGYTSGPPLAQAARMGIPTVVIEPNSYPGLTVRWLNKRVDKIFLGYDQATKYLKESNCVVSGIPVSEMVINATREEGIHSLGLLAGKTCLLCVGGSLGAENINKAVLDFVVIAHAEEKELLTGMQIYHQTGGKGPAELEGLRLEYPEADYVKTDYIDHMPFALAASDLVISRAGAATLNEIKARGLPSVLIPYPHSAEGHQLKNARSLADQGAAIIIEDHKLSGRSLFNVIIPLMKDPERRNEMGKKAKQMFNPDCTDIIYTEITKLIEKNK